MSQSQQGFQLPQPGGHVGCGGADTQVFRSFIPLPDGTEFEMMTVTYTRRR